MGLIGRHNGRKWFSRGRGEAWKILTALEYRWNNRRKSMITGVEIWNTFCNSGLPNGSGYFVTPQRSWDSKYFTIPKTIDGINYSNVIVTGDQWFSKPGGHRFLSESANLRVKTKSPPRIRSRDLKKPCYTFYLFIFLLSLSLSLSLSFIKFPASSRYATDR